MNLLQTWLVLGVPLLAISSYLFVGRSKQRARLGYVGLVTLVVLLVVVPTGAGQGRAISAGLVGLLVVGLVAVGRGTDADDAYAEHHQTRRRFTTAEGS